jgi:hypothetical protein
MMMAFSAVTITIWMMKAFDLVIITTIVMVIFGMMTDNHFDDDCF